MKKIKINYICNYKYYNYCIKKIIKRKKEEKKKQQHWV
jgi:hypothetical protein